MASHGRRVRSNSHRRQQTSPPPEPLGGPSGVLAREELEPIQLQLGVSSGEQVFVDPQNRDAVLLPRRDTQLPEGLSTTTAYTVDVQREGLTYSVPVRFSRFERLHAELSRELPGVLLPPLPQKRGPLDLNKLKALVDNTHVDPRAIEQRTAALDSYLRALAALPGVAQSRAMAELLALPPGLESVVRHARQQDGAQEERVGSLQQEARPKPSLEPEAATSTERSLERHQHRAALRTASAPHACGSRAPPAAGACAPCAQLATTHAYVRVLRHAKARSDEQVGAP